MQIDEAQFLTSRRRLFGRRQRPIEASAHDRSSAIDDLRLFALTFVGGFLFMAVYLA